MAEMKGDYQHNEKVDEQKYSTNHVTDNINNESEALPPVFLGNLLQSYSADAVTELFERPIQPSEKSNYYSIPVDRIDIKRGYAFVFLKDARGPEDKDNVEGFVMDINGMEVSRVSQSLRAEFARGDGRVKKKEDERRRNINPSETLFVVNFHEETTRQEDLQMLFEPYGQLVRIDMKRNYAFVQFKSIDDAALAREKTNGGRLDQSVLTVEFVANKRRPEDRINGRFDRRRDDRGGSWGRRDDDRGGRDVDRYDDRRREVVGNGISGHDGRGGHDIRRSGRYDDTATRYDRNERRTREMSPNRGAGPRSRSRSRSPFGGRYRRNSRSPPGAGMFDRRPVDRFDDHRGGGRGPSPVRRGQSPPSMRAGRGPSPARDSYRNDRDHRGYRY